MIHQKRAAIAIKGYGILIIPFTQYFLGLDTGHFFCRLIPSNNPSLAIDNQGGIRQKIQNIGHYPLFNFLIAIQYPVLPVIYYYHS
jgi:hypothetical protein